MNSVLLKNKISIFFLSIWFFSFLHFIHLGIQYYRADCHHSSTSEHTSCENFLDLQILFEKSKVLVPLLLSTLFFVFKNTVILPKQTFISFKFVSLLTKLFSRGILHSKVH